MLSAWPYRACSTGTGNDAAVIEMVMRFAAKRRGLLRAFICAQGDAALIEQHLDFTCWLLDIREGLKAPKCRIEHRVQPTQTATVDELQLTGGDSWV
ncbi:MAG: hypothetical protein ACRDHX_00565 [Chloroflexota bacterium]